MKALEQEQSLFISVLVFLNSWNYMLSWFEHENKFYNLGACFYAVIDLSLLVWPS